MTVDHERMRQIEEYRAQHVLVKRAFIAQAREVFGEEAARFWARIGDVDLETVPDCDTAFRAMEHAFPPTPEQKIMVARAVIEFIEHRSPHFRGTA